MLYIFLFRFHSLDSRLPRHGTPLRSEQLLFHVFLLLFCNYRNWIIATNLNLLIHIPCTYLCRIYVSKSRKKKFLEIKFCVLNSWDFFPKIVWGLPIKSQEIRSQEIKSWRKYIQTTSTIFLMCIVIQLVPSVIDVYSLHDSVQCTLYN